MSEHGTSPEYHRAFERSSIRTAHLRHPYAYHIRRLPAAIRAMVPELAVPDGGHVLDYGCADMPYRLFFGSGVDYVGADLPGNDFAAITLRPDGTVPVDDARFDAVLSTQVLEHVQAPKTYVAECFRVIRPGGRLLLTTHGVFPYHPDPVDFWRWTGAGLRAELEAAGFDVLRVQGIIGMAATGLQLFQDALSYRLPRRLVPWLALVMQPIIGFVDRFETPESLGFNAQVFAILAMRPG
jgi:SAM-dependent methyltransferase